MMTGIDLGEIGPLTDFKRRTAEYLRKLKSTGRPRVLTVNGKAELVVQDARSYQRLLAHVDRAEALAGVLEGLEDVKAGRTKPLDEAFAEVRRSIRKR